MPTETVWSSCAMFGTVSSGQPIMRSMLHPGVGCGGPVSLSGAGGDWLSLPETLGKARPGDGQTRLDWRPIRCSVWVGRKPTVDSSYLGVGAAKAAQAAQAAGSCRVALIMKSRGPVEPIEGLLESMGAIQDLWCNFFRGLRVESKGNWKQ